VRTGIERGEKVERRDPILHDLNPGGRHPKPILNEIKWRGLDMDRCEIDILHRGAADDMITIRGGEISLGRSFFTLGETMIPYHRILRIRYDGVTVFKRGSLQTPPVPGRRDEDNI
jgi:hypothetical protein